MRHTRYGVTPANQLRDQGLPDCSTRSLSSGCFTAIVGPDGQLIGEPLRAGEGEVRRQGRRGLALTRAKRKPLTEEAVGTGAGWARKGR